jgi:hypothetical protein
MRHLDGPILFKNRLHLAGRPQMSARKQIPVDFMHSLRA